MWPLSPLTNNVVCLHFTPTTISCTWIVQHTKTIPFQLRAHHTTKYTTKKTTCYLYNNTAIRTIIHTFLKRYALQHAFIAATLSGDPVVEHIVTLPTSSPERHNFAHLPLNSCLWDFCYLYPTHNGHATFYVCGMPHTLIIQQQLFAVAANLNLVTLTTSLNALLAAYKYIHRSSFSYSQLTNPMERNHNKLETLFSMNILNNTLHIPPHINIDLAQEKITLINALGLFLLSTHHE